MHISIRMILVPFRVVLSAYLHFVVYIPLLFSSPQCSNPFEYFFDAPKSNNSIYLLRRRFFGFLFILNTKMPATVSRSTYRIVSSSVFHFFLSSLLFYMQSVFISSFFELWTTTEKSTIFRSVWHNFSEMYEYVFRSVVAYKKKTDDYRQKPVWMRGETQQQQNTGTHTWWFIFICSIFHRNFYSSFRLISLKTICPNVMDKYKCCCCFVLGARK